MLRNEASGVLMLPRMAPVAKNAPPFVASIAETPFGGVTESGYGREGDPEGLECYSVAKNVSHLIM
jgi:acyl-CoA reductase-like NAD-dependent aldehyde dehydrogenase